MVYTAITRVRAASLAVAGSDACSRISAAPRSLPMPLTMPAKPATASATGPEATANPAVPIAPHAVTPIRNRRRPIRSAVNVAASAASAAPARPAEITAPSAARSMASAAR